MSANKFTDEFKRDAAAQVGDRGYRKLHDDLCDLGEDISPNRAWRLARLAGIRAQIGYKKKPGYYGGSPAVVADNTLNRALDVDAPDQFCLSAIKDNRLLVTDDRHHLYPHPRRVPVSGPSTLGLNQWRSNVSMIDLFSRRVMGWSMQGRTYADLPLQALLMAVWRRKPKTKTRCIPLLTVCRQTVAGQRTKGPSSPAMSGRSSSNSTILRKA